jgi:hypothetical protein
MVAVHPPKSLKITVRPGGTTSWSVIFILVSGETSTLVRVSLKVILLPVTLQQLAALSFTILRTEEQVADACVPLADAVAVLVTINVPGSESEAMGMVYETGTLPPGLIVPRLPLILTTPDVLVSTTKVRGVIVIGPRVN